MADNEPNRLEILEFEHLSSSSDVSELQAFDNALESSSTESKGSLASNNAPPVIDVRTRSLSNPSQAKAVAALTPRRPASPPPRPEYPPANPTYHSIARTSDPQFCR